jgi:hypothetical protein
MGGQHQRELHGGSPGGEVEQHFVRLARRSGRQGPPDLLVEGIEIGGPRRQPHRVALHGHARQPQARQGLLQCRAKCRPRSRLRRFPGAGIVIQQQQPGAAGRDTRLKAGQADEQPQDGAAILTLGRKKLEIGLANERQNQPVFCSIPCHGRSGKEIFRQGRTGRERQALTDRRGGQRPVLGCRHRVPLQVFE